MTQSPRAHRQGCQAIALGRQGSQSSQPRSHPLVQRLLGENKLEEEAGKSGPRENAPWAGSPGLGF